MSAGHSTSGVLAKLPAEDLAFTNTYQKNTRVFKTQYMIPLNLSNRFTINRYQDITCRKIYK
jgi:hypothetical protein